MKTQQKKVIFGALFLILILLISVLGISYAWYSFTHARTSFYTTTGTTGVTLDFTQSQYLNVVGGAPIQADEVLDEINPEIFTITISPEVTQALVTIKMVNITMDDELKDSYFRYALYQGSVQVSSGNFGGFTGNTVTLVESVSLCTNQSYTYYLYMWIEDDGACTNADSYASCTTQNDMMGKSFNGVIQIDSITSTSAADSTADTCTPVNGGPVLVPDESAGNTENEPIYSSVSPYTLTGTVTDEDSTISSVTINGESATVDGDTYSGDVALVTGMNVVRIVATSSTGETRTLIRYVYYDGTDPSLTVTTPAGTSSSNPTYTNASSYAVTGIATDEESGIATVKVNGNDASIDSSGNYSYSLTLSGGSNTVTVVATDNAGRTNSLTRYVYYDSTAPTLTVSAPTGTSSSSPTVVSESGYTVSGTATDSSGITSVTVNGVSVTVGSDGSFSKSLTLVDGEVTTVTIVAVDNSGQSTSVTRYVQYVSDAEGPTITVTAPTGTSSSSPTYYQSDSSVTYTVTGTVSDTSGVSSVTVNGTAVTVSNESFSTSLSLATNTTHTITIVAKDTAGNSTTATRYVRVEAYYQQAARLAGTTVQTSLANTLTNSDVCTAIAGNSTAYGIMKTHYKSNITTYNSNESYFSTGLNKLALAVGARFYLYRVVGTTYYTNLVTWITSGSVNMSGGNDTGTIKGIRMVATSNITSSSVINTAVYGKVVANIAWLGPGRGNIGFWTGSGWNGVSTWYTTSSAGIYSPSANVSSGTLAIRSECSERDQVINYIYVEPR